MVNATDHQLLSVFDSTDDGTFLVNTFPSLGIQNSPHSAFLLSLRVLLFILFYRLTPYPTSKCGNALENSILDPLLFFLYISSQLKISFPRALNTFCKSLARIVVSLVQTSVLSC